jgi:hypothetical protein
MTPHSVNAFSIDVDASHTTAQAELLSLVIPRLVGSYTSGSSINSAMFGGVLLLSPLRSRHSDSGPTTRRILARVLCIAHMGERCSEIFGWGWSRSTSMFWKIRKWMRPSLFSSPSVAVRR